MEKMVTRHGGIQRASSSKESKSEIQSNVGNIIKRLYDVDNWKR